MSVEYHLPEVHLIFKLIDCHMERNQNDDVGGWLLEQMKLSIIIVDVIKHPDRGFDLTSVKQWKVEEILPVNTSWWEFNLIISICISLYLRLPTQFYLIIFSSVGLGHYQMIAKNARTYSVIATVPTKPSVCCTGCSSKNNQINHSGEPITHGLLTRHFVVSSKNCKEDRGVVHLCKHNQYM